MCSRCFIHFEETFHLPTFPIEFCYGQVGVSEVVGQESIDIACGIILINDHAETVSLMTESLITPVCVSTGISSMAAYFILSLALVTKNAY